MADYNKAEPKKESEPTILERLKRLEDWLPSIQDAQEKNHEEINNLRDKVGL